MDKLLREILTPAIFAFIIGTAFLVIVSRKALAHPGSHGFYRFFAWEILLVQLVLNVNRWFQDPFSPYQLVSWALLCISLIPLGLGGYAYFKRAKPQTRNNAEKHLFAFERTSELVTTGVYAYIRHPMYSSMLYLTWGIFFKLPDWLGLALAAGATAFLIATARADERECVRYFGSAYEEYITKTARFIPYLF